MSQQFEGVVVQKPWGWERLIYRNATVELWHLFIEYNRQTSLHCHPTKKTGLVVLDGRARVTFLNDQFLVPALGKVMIRPGLFHSTLADAPGGLHLLEIETPPDKDNLVRLEDPYGRAWQPYEAADKYRPALESLKLETENTPYQLAGCGLMLLRPGRSYGLPGIAKPQDLLMVLSGELFDQRRTQLPVLCAGDVVDVRTFWRLADAFADNDLLTVLVTKG